MKSILNESQYEKWTTMTEKKQRMGKRKKANKHKKKRRGEKHNEDND